MASPSCWRCLVRPSQRVLRPQFLSSTASAPSAPFSTSSRLLAKDKTPAKASVRGGKQFSLKKNKRKGEKGAPVKIGERKAFRKRILLSNDNAIEVRGLQDFTAETLASNDAVGSMVKLPVPVVDQLRAVDAFKSSQNWGLFRSPHVLVRQQTVDFMKPILEAVEKKEVARVVVTGERSSGKSILGLEVLTTAFLKDWIVINIPEAQELTYATTDYSKISNSHEYSQPAFILNLMNQMHKACGHILSKLQVQLSHENLPNAVSVNRQTTLDDMTTSTKETELAWPVFDALMRELVQPGRPPILFMVDGVNHLMRISDYRSPKYERIHSHDLSLVRHFADALGGKAAAWPNGGAVVGITTKGNWYENPSLENALGLAVAAEKSTKPPARDPYYKHYDERIFESLKGVKVFNVESLTKPEARSLMEYWAASGMLRLRIDEATVSEKWMMAGSGIVGELEKVSLFNLNSKV